MYQKVMVPLDGSELAECVLPHVEAVVKAAGIKNVTLVRVVEPLYIPTRYVEYGISEGSARRIEVQSQKAAKDYLDQIASRLRYRDDVKVQTEVLSGRDADSLIDYASKNQVDLIIIATHGRSGVSRWLLGSVASRILHSAHIPVLMVRGPGGSPTV